MIGRCRREGSTAQNFCRLDLPAEMLRCTIRLAYQAADAGHPNRGSASSPPSKETSPTEHIFARLNAAQGPNRKGNTPRGKSRPYPASIPKTGPTRGFAMGLIGCWSSNQASVYQAAILQGDMAGCMRSEAPLRIARYSAMIGPLAVVFPVPTRAGGRQNNRFGAGSRAGRKRPGLKSKRAKECRATPEVQCSAGKHDVAPGSAMHQTAHCQEVHA